MAGTPIPDRESKTITNEFLSKSDYPSAAAGKGVDVYVVAAGINAQHAAFCTRDVPLGVRDGMDEFSRSLPTGFAGA
eukprot:tig00000786_g4057.t1